MRLSDWLRRRQELSTSVLAAVHETNSGFRLKGSFARRNFHLLDDGSETFSDIDLVLPGHTGDHRSWEADVAERMIRRGWRIRVSVKHFDPLEAVAPADSQLLALTELARFNARRTEPRFDSYILAKTSLTLVHGSDAQHEKGWPDNLLQHAELAKLGFVTGFTGDCAVRMVEGLPKSPVVDHFRELVWKCDVDRVHAWTISRLKHSTMHPWLRDRMTRILEESAG
ncbi:hypothetical protein [Amycolatopsis eburnea]|uniref:Uncharacterized protein n=1 Tax=Amycolatopsis eburnea TaxID=2267691 RepID=A0A3R9KQJ3_9PSEU|nr:hypothetical protein [Amycolatopsis eburnea]RSD22811.1 hypothetical protein EIY87_06550 [Amycolatopsis eburnea]